MLGPDSRPSNEEESEPTTNQSESSETTTIPGHGVQNFFMQRMSDILTQLVTRTSTTTETEETEPATTLNNTQTNQSPIIAESNDNRTTRDSPAVQTPPSPSLAQNSATPTTTNNNTNDDDEDDNESDVSFI